MNMKSQEMQRRKENESNKIEQVYKTSLQGTILVLDDFTRNYIYDSIPLFTYGRTNYCF